MSLTISRCDCQTSCPIREEEEPCRFCHSLLSCFRRWFNSWVSFLHSPAPVCLLLASLGVHRRADQYSAHPGIIQPPISKRRHLRPTILSIPMMVMVILKAKGQEGIVLPNIPAWWPCYSNTGKFSREIVMSQCRSSSKLSKSLIAFTVVEPPCSCSPHLATSLITGACQKSNPIVFHGFKKKYFSGSNSQTQIA